MIEAWYLVLGAGISLLSVLAGALVMQRHADAKAVLRLRDDVDHLLKAQAIERFREGTKVVERLQEVTHRPEQPPVVEPEPEAPALPLDPDNPPVSRVYSPQPGRTSPPPLCHCHARPLTPGDEVLWWPIPDSHGGGVRVLHADWVSEQAQRA